MEQYVVSARKYRPSTFNSVVGQKSLTSTLKNAIATDRLAHAYLFCGSRGVGKTSCARIFAKTINCSNPTADGEACNECESCRQFNANRSLNIIELDAASHNGVDDMKQLMEQVLVPPSLGKYRVFIIDEVHMLSNAAFNAFLKTLEEPPSYVIFILATTEKHKIIPTILSRCQIYDFNRITISDMVEHLKYVASQENITADPAALSVIAAKADGAMRDALSIFDQVAACSRGNITYEGTIENLNVLDHAYYYRLLECFLNGDVSNSLLIFKEIRDKGFDPQFFINGLAQYLRDIMVARDPITLPLLEAPDNVRQEMMQMGQRYTPLRLYAAIDLCNTADLNYRQSSNKQLLVELTLIKLCQLSDTGAAQTPEQHPLQATNANGQGVGQTQQAQAQQGAQQQRPGGYQQTGPGGYSPQQQSQQTGYGRPSTGYSAYNIQNTYRQNAGQMANRQQGAPSQPASGAPAGAQGGSAMGGNVHGQESQPGQPSEHQPSPSVPPPQSNSNPSSAGNSYPYNQQQQPSAYQAQQSPTPHRTSTLGTPGLNLRSGSLNINNRGNGTFGTQQGQGDPNNQASSESAQKVVALNPESLMKLWTRFIEEHPQEKILINCMRLAEDTLQLQGDKVSMTVASQTAKESITSHLDDILSYLRGSTANPNITLEVNVNMEQNSSMAMDERTFLRHIRDTYPEAGEFIDTLKLSLT